MAATISSKYGTNNQTITCSVASLATGTAQQSTAIDNTSNVFLDALVAAQIKAASSGVSANGTVTIYAYGTVDGGTTYSDGASGTDGSITLTVPPNMRPIGTINLVANSQVAHGGPFSVAAAFGGVLPDHWGIVVLNSSGNALDATGGNHVIRYQGILAQSV